jgi:Ser/Thr protein kinase RdoA (MazF antagonist)
VKQVLPEYRLGEIAACDYYSHGINDTYRVRTTAGETYYLRVYRSAWRDREQISFELDALTHLQRKGFPAAHPLHRPDGSFLYTLEAPEGRRYAAVFCEAPGEQLSYDEEPAETAYRYAWAVAEMHNALDDFSSAHRRPAIDLEHLVEAPLRHVQPYLSAQPEQWEALCKIAGRVREGILAAGALEQGFVHGDLQGYHANRAPDGRLTFYDFDCCGPGYRAYDLAVFRWCSRLKEQEAVWWEPYLCGYQEVRPIPPNDLKANPLFVACRYLWHMGLHTENAYDWGVDWLNKDYFEEKLGYLRTLAEEEGF